MSTGDIPVKQNPRKTVPLAEAQEAQTAARPGAGATEPGTDDRRNYHTQPLPPDAPQGAAGGARDRPHDPPITTSNEENGDWDTTIHGMATDASDDTQMLDEDQIPSVTRNRSLQGLAVAAQRDIGRVRQTNQDSVLALLTTLPREARDVPLGLFVVADGMGGHDGGEIASRIAIRSVLHRVLAQLVMPALDDEMIEALQPLMVGAVEEANEAIQEHARTVGSDMGTTCTAVLLLGQALYIAHVGDSRAYVLDPDGLRTLTNDHSTVGRLIQMGKLKPAAAATHPQRNQLYRSVGQQPKVQVDFIYQPVGKISHLLLCSDGLWGMITHEEIEQALRESQWPQDMCDELIAMANMAGGEDNIGVVVATLPVLEEG